MDIQLNGPSDGIAAAEEIRSRWQIPVVFVTASAGQEILSRAKAAGPYGYLTKPFRGNELNATISVALERRRLTRDLEESNTELTRFCYAVSHDLQARCGLSGRLSICFRDNFKARFPASSPS